MNPVQQAFGFTSSPPKTPARSNRVIEASAGTGKTTAIVGQVLNLLLENPGLDPGRIVLVTFTEKAAGEIADRIRTALEDLDRRLDSGETGLQWPPDSPDPRVVIRDVGAARRAVTSHLANIDALHSQTIHSFCQSILRAFPIESGLDPQFRIVQGFERAVLVGQLYDAWLDQETRVDARPEWVQEWELLFTHVGYFFLIREHILGLVERRDLLGEVGYDPGSMDDVIGDLRETVESIRKCKDPVADPRAAALFDHIRASVTPETDDIDEWIAWSAPTAPAVREVNLTGFKSAVLRGALKVLRGDESKKSSIHDRLISHRAAVALMDLTRRFVSFLDAEKRRLGVADFDDLLLRTLALLDDPEVLSRVRGRFDTIFVDEFQDTDRTQAAIIRQLATDDSGRFVPGKLVIVGDPKQSIYGFRRADPETYYRMAMDLEREGAVREVIEKQFRSDPPLIGPLNAMFERLFPHQVHDPLVFRPEYSAIEAARPASRRELDARFTVLEMRSDDADGRFTAEAETIADWIESVRDRGGNDLRRFALLFRRVKTNLDDYLEVLQRRGIDYVLPPTVHFLDRPAAVDLVAVLRAVAWPFDRGAQISAARSPYFGLTDREITDGVIAEAPDPESAWGRFAAAIESFRTSSQHSSVAQLIELVIATCAIEEVYHATEGGHRSLRHLEHLRSIAFDFDQRAGGSVRQFVDEIQSRRREPEEMEPILSDESRNAVRILTVHGAKGLEFETVILPDLSFNVGSSDTSSSFFAVDAPEQKSLVLTGGPETISANFRSAGGEKLKKIGQAREDAEMRRLFYVAVTRAMTDVVFVCNPRANKSGFYRCLLEALGTDKDGLAQRWPDTGRVVHQTVIGPVAFEVVRRGADAPAAPEMPRLLDGGVESRLRESDIVPLTIDAPALELPLLGAGEVAARHAGTRKRAAGILLHRLLELWDGQGDPEPLLRRLALEAGCDADTASLVRNRIGTVVRSEAFRRLQAAETIGREMPLRFVEDGRTVERRIDRLVREGGRELVVDYKSGAPDPARVARDRVQVEQYCLAIRTITGRPCEGLLWYIDLEEDAVVEVGRTLNVER